MPIVIQAAVIIQRHVRGCQVRHRMASRIAAAVCLQAKWRQRQAAVKFACVRQAAILLQAHARGHAVRKHVATMTTAVTLIQVCMHLHIQLYCVQGNLF